MKSFVYGLADPRDGRIRYVGQSNCPERRLVEHKSVSRQSVATRKARWLCDLMESGIEPELVILAEGDSSAIDEQEQTWMDSLPDLTNVKLTSEPARSPWHAGLTKADHPSIAIGARKRAAKLKGRKRPPGFGLKLSRILKGRTGGWNKGLTAATDPRLSAMGRKVSKTKLGHEVSVATRQKISATLYRRGAVQRLFYEGLAVMLQTSYMGARAWMYYHRKHGHNIQALVAQRVRPFLKVRAAIAEGVTA